MPSFGPVSRRELIRALQNGGFSGPYPGGRHAFMVKDQLRLRIPNPHQRDIGVALLSRIMKQAGISREDWERL